MKYGTCNYSSNTILDARCVSCYGEYNGLELLAKVNK